MDKELFTRLPVVDQLVAYLRGAITSGESASAMPGIRRLAGTLLPYERADVELD